MFEGVEGIVGSYEAAGLVELSLETVADTHVVFGSVVHAVVIDGLNKGSIHTSNDSYII